LSRVERDTVVVLLIAVSRVAPRAAVTDVSLPAGLGGLLVHDCQGPAPAGELAGDRDVGDCGAFLPGDHLLPSMVETLVAFMPAGRCRWWCGRPPRFHRFPGAVGDPVMPGGFDEEAAGVTIAGFRDRSLRPGLARGVF